MKLQHTQTESRIDHLLFLKDPHQQLPVDHSQQGASGQHSHHRFDQQSVPQYDFLYTDFFLFIKIEAEHIPFL